MRIINEIKENTKKFLNEFQENTAKWNKEDNVEHERGIQYKYRNPERNLNWNSQMRGFQDGS
jgi:hypothetical protein